MQPEPVAAAAAAAAAAGDARSSSRRAESQLMHGTPRSCADSALEVTNINFLIAHFATIYENIISLHVSLTFCLQCFDAVGWAAGRASGL